MKLARLAGGPHFHSLFNVPRTMLSVMICLAPATGYGFYQFGWPAVYLFAVTVVSAVVFEVFCLWIGGRPILRSATDGSAVLTGWILAMTLPPWAPWWIGVLGSGIALVVGKHVFGGLGQNLFNPAMVARAALLIAVPVQMTFWVAPLNGAAGPDPFQALTITFGAAIPFDAVSSASVLGHIKSQLSAGLTMDRIFDALPAVEDQFYGRIPGSLGETSAFLLLLGGVCLGLMRIITWIIPLTVLGTVFALSSLAWWADPAQFAPPLLHLTSGAVMMCAFFIATDYVTSPVTRAGRALYGIGIGALIFVIRTWGAFPEGVAFAVLLMNGAAPLIDAYVRPRIFGRTLAGKPIALGDGND